MPLSPPFALLRPYYAGVASTVVGRDTHSAINIIKRGEMLISEDGMAAAQQSATPWGSYSAIDFIDDVACYAVSAALAFAPDGYGSWVNLEML